MLKSLVLQACLLVDIVAYGGSLFTQRRMAELSFCCFWKLYLPVNFMIHCAFVCGICIFSVSHCSVEVYCLDLILFDLLSLLYQSTATLL